MKEDLLHFVWNTRRFLPQQLRTTAGETIEILAFGHLNGDAGPDFLNARIRIGDTLWVGNVEMHLQASDWDKHGHGQDPAYDNVILHVVLNEDRPARRSDGSRIPCLELRKHLPEGLLQQYHRLLHTLDWIPCAGQIGRMDPVLLNIWLEQLVVRRLEQKVQRLRPRWEATGRDWNETAYREVARYLGAPVNQEPMEELARRIPLVQLQRLRQEPLQQEALFLGQAGMLEGRDFEEEYPRRLQQEYHFLRKKFSLQPMTATSWKFSRMRPAHFPDLRMVQLAALIRQAPKLMGLWMEAETPREAMEQMEVQVQGYWMSHYRLDSDSEQKKAKSLGRATLHSLLINAAVPLLFLYGQERKQEKWKEKSIGWLEKLPPEHNRILREWKNLGIRAENAAQSQALIYLKRFYCDERACLQCSIGQKLMSEPFLNYFRNIHPQKSI